MPEGKQVQQVSLKQLFVDLQGWVARLDKRIEALEAKADLLMKHSKAPHMH